MRTTFLLLSLLVLASCSSSRFDTSTPKSYVTSFGLIAEGPEGEDPLPYFYNEESAAAIKAYDDIGAISLEKFQDFKTQLSEKFPDRVASISMQEIKVKVGTGFFNTRSFKLTGSLIITTLKGRATEDYEFVSATEANEEGELTLTCKIEGDNVDLQLKDFGDGYRMFLHEKNLETFYKMKKFFNKADELLTGYLAEMEELTEENYDSTVQDWNDSFMQLIQICSKSLLRRDINYFKHIISHEA